MTDFQHQHTVLGYTETTDGPVAHLRVIAGDVVLQAPVMLITRRKGDGVLQRPRINAEGRYLHAMPGGHVVVGRFVK